MQTATDSRLALRYVANKSKISWTETN